VEACPCIAKAMAMKTTKTIEGARRREPATTITPPSLAATPDGRPAVNLLRLGRPRGDNVK
jgi:hypothetical protein